jgi:hypothetical protein
MTLWMIVVGAVALGLFYWLFFVPPKRLGPPKARLEEAR